MWDVDCRLHKSPQGKSQTSAYRICISQSTWYAQIWTFTVSSISTSSIHVGFCGSDAMGPIFSRAPCLKGDCEGEFPKMNCARTGWANLMSCIHTLRGMREISKGASIGFHD